MEKWFVTAKRADFKEISSKFGINQVTARIIRNRDIVGDEAIKEYLNGGLADLHDPKLLRGAREAVALLNNKINEGKKIRIIGDYDIDGVNATYILYKGLLRCNANVDYEIPDRMKDGYGINEQLIQYAYEEGVDTIVTCDNGIAAIDQIAYAKNLGMTVIITDHHELLFKEEEREKICIRPNADVIINPKQPECNYPFPNLCGAAVAFKLISCMFEDHKIPKEEAEAFIEFAAIATVGDVMDLIGENRIIVKEGLRRLTNTQNNGLKSLIKVNGLEESDICAYHIGFVLGPCINASGRLDTAKRALALLLAESEGDALRMAEELKSLNDERKAMTLKGFEQAVELVETTELKEDKVLVVYLPDCHESLAGIIAGRIRERFHKPVFVLTDAEDGVKGSGRSIEAYNMFEEMVKCQELFTKFGGHPMAAGLSIKKEDVETLRIRLNELTTLTEDDFIPRVSIDVAMPIDYISEELIEELEVLEPFGKANPKPVFAEKNLNVLSARILGQNKNVIKMQVLNSQGMVMDAMYFGDVEKFNTYITEKFGTAEVEKMYQNRENTISISATYYPQVNVFRNVRNMQIVIQNYN
ncbi:single-stranded-DNA-specific exonuclease RecJ [Robinsoniella sp. KNHs210]|uniref:single-stranded-DNA-specific exonuclease RecJ n=1 Tax=Robinsoniella sp. KNHs210 TaxID=1469950 RepID=UPI000480CFF7|nr:single-stranded-DNA-specific exonuclease RecJ [Robinsoniella sp. KNHs210]